MERPVGTKAEVKAAAGAHVDAWWAFYEEVNEETLRQMILYFSRGFLAATSMMEAKSLCKNV
eukprot:12413253-Karenia_brevis.AAC.1